MNRYTNLNAIFRSNKHITKCYTEELPDGLMRGTYDNSITNAALLHTMLEGRLPCNVLAAFTGDEECFSQGANDVVAFARKHLNLHHVVVLDVTDMGWEQEADFTIENNFWGEALEKAVIASAEESGYKWCFVPSDEDYIPINIDYERVIPVEAEEDESWEYDEHDVACFSLCIPVFGEMHSNKGVYARQKSFERYTYMLEKIANI